MKKYRVDALIAGIGVLCAIILVGMALNMWSMIIFATPLLIAVLFLLGSLNSSDEWNAKALAANGIYSGVLIVLFWAAGLTYGNGGMLWGMSTSRSIFTYVFWPLTTVTAGVFYAYVFKTWLSKDIAVSTGPTDHDGNPSQ